MQALHVIYKVNNMSLLQNDRLIKALFKQPVDRTPIWLMRQAGRYLPEYRKLRAQHKDFFAFCQNPEVACEVTLQPLRRFALDAAIIFSDILTLPIAMGCDIQMIPGKGPVAPNPVRSEQVIDALQTEGCLEKLNYVMQAIDRTVKALDGSVPLIGFSGSPWTVATYMVEGQSSKTFEVIKTMMYRSPDVLHKLLQKLTDVTVEYLNAQVKAGARVLMVFDSWGGVLSPACYQQFSLSYMTQIANRVERMHNGHQIPLVFFSKGCGLYLDAMASSGCDALGIDWTMDLEKARRQVGDSVALQGNLDPFALFASPEKVQEMATNILKSYQSDTGHVFNLGHGISKDTPVESVSALVEAVAGSGACLS